MKDVFDDFDDITNNEDLRRYSRQCDYTLEMQEAFIKLLDGEYADEGDSQLKKVSDVSKIKLVIGLK